ncbi:splicing factor putative [Plasmodium cynomolgi strain B]|uniref:Splicing factor putative n=1 Tax=Plasmodium cynomolgi (strain B) TaxID=1120755 RepID=K6USN1_PLACD|nr:splicing factor putative [Plasmodium cynomolgi strain B]GAB66244.1 splicing factor putative [Plasmodium cynomolgi strain B]
MEAKRSECDAGKREGGKKHKYGKEEMNGGVHAEGHLSGDVQYDLEIETRLEDEDSANHIGSGASGAGGTARRKHNHINVGNLKDEVVQNDFNNDDLDDKALGLVNDKSIRRRENEFQRRKYDYMISPGRADPFGDKSPSPGERTYADVMMDVNKESNKMKLSSGGGKAGASGGTSSQAGGNRRMRWGVTESSDAVGREPGESVTSSKSNEGIKKEQGKSKWDILSGEESKSTSFGNMATPAPSKWVDTPFILNDGGEVKKKKISRWDKVGEGTAAGAADSLAQSDMMKTPKVVPLGGLAAGGVLSGGVAAGGATPGGMLKTPYLVPGSGNFVNTPYVLNQLGNASAMFTPMTPGVASQAIDSIIKMKIKNEMEIRNRPLTDEDLDELLPSEGYEIVKPPEEYEAIRRNKLKAFFKTVASTAGTPLLMGSSGVIGGVPASLQGEKTGEHSTGVMQTPYLNNNMMSSTLVGGTLPSGTPFYEIPTATTSQMKDTEGGGGDTQTTLLQSRQFEINNPQLLSELKYVQLKNEDFIYFSKLFQTVDESDLSQEELKERKLMILLLKIKNGTPSVRRAALRAITDKVKELGPEILFNLILPLMMHNTLEDQERHLLVKVIDRILFKLDDLVRPYVHKILVVIEPLLIDEDYYARVEGREIISNLAKAAGLATMIGIMRPDIDHPDEYVRNTTARAFAVVASALGIPSLILFLKAVCQSKKNWEARHTGIKIVQQIAILMGCAVLPHLRQLVSIVAHGLHDEQQKVKTITALAIAALAEAAAPYGIEAFDSVLRPLWKGITEHRGKVLAAFLKAIGLIIPLMDPYHASYYTREVMVILINEFNSPDEEMKKVVLKCVKQCIQTEGIEKDYINQEVVNPFFDKFWVLRTSHDKRNLHLIVETTVEISNKIGGAAVIGRIVDDLKDPSEQFRKMVMQTIQSIVNNQGVDDIDQTLEEQLIDGILYAFQEQASEDYYVLLNSFDAIVNKLQIRMKPYLPQIAGIIRWRLNTPLPKIRQQSAELIGRIASLMHLCEEHQMLGHLALYLYEYLGEEYPEVLGNIIGALKSIVVVLGVHNMTPPIKDLLPRITPILKNRHEKVQENVIDLIGIIADKGGDLVSPKEWDRICFDLIELLKSNKKLIRRATIQTFGYIARTIGPFEVLTVLLNNLRVQERQLRVCTTVAIAIVADTCLPYSVLAALMNEYRTQDLNVQNGVLKALSFMFEYIGEIAKDYVYAVVPLLEHALMDRDLVHRQIATWACKHLALGCFGLNREDALIHLLNYVWPNIFETSPHLIQAVIDSIDGFRVALGPAIIFQYLVQGIFHPSRKVREIYWKIYNNVYIGHQDSLVPVYPPFERLADSNFARDELRYTLKLPRYWLFLFLTSGDRHFLGGSYPSILSGGIFTCGVAVTKR